MQTRTKPKRRYNHDITALNMLVAHINISVHNSVDVECETNLKKIAATLMPTSILMKYQMRENIFLGKNLYQPPISLTIDYIITIWLVWYYHSCAIKQETL